MDRLSSWTCIYYFGPRQCTSASLISVCRSLFTVYGAPEQFSSDGGTQLNTTAFKEFLSRWELKHRLSSVEYPQSNGRAQLGVKAAKCIYVTTLLQMGRWTMIKLPRPLCNIETHCSPTSVLVLHKFSFISTSETTFQLTHHIMNFIRNG